MSAERRRVALAALVAIGLAIATPRPASAHAIGGAFQLPVPLWLYLLAAAVAVAASFIVTVVVTRRATDPDYRTVVVPDALAAVLRGLLRVLGLLWWYGAIVVGFVVADISPLPAVLLWVGIWVALPITAALAGNPWPSLSPFRTTLRRARVARAPPGHRAPRCRPPLPARARPLAGGGALRGRSLVRADPARERPSRRRSPR